MDRCAEALPLLERALALGVNAGRNGMRAALLAEPRFDAIRESDRALLMTGRDPRAEAGDRRARWRADLRWYRALLARAHPEPFHRVEAAAWHAAADRLDASIESASDLKIIAGFMELASRVGDGHTAVYPPTDGDFAWHLLPFYPVWLAGIALQFSEFHDLAGATRDPEVVSLDLELADGAFHSAPLPRGKVDRDPNARWAPAGWPSLFGDAPLWLSRAEEPFRHERLHGTSIVVAQVNQTANSAWTGGAPTTSGPGSLRMCPSGRPGRI